MSLKTLLSEQKGDIVKRWFEKTISSYSGEARGFMKKEKDSFSNPVGNTISKELGSVFNEILGEGDTERIKLPLESIIKIRAVQDFQPSQAVAFVLELKQVIREVTEDSSEGSDLLEELPVWNDKIDALALLAFDVYSECREKLYQVRVNEIKRGVSRVMERANLSEKMPKAGPDF